MTEPCSLGASEKYKQPLYHSSTQLSVKATALLTDPGIAAAQLQPGRFLPTRWNVAKVKFPLRCYYAFEE